MNVEIGTEAAQLPEKGIHKWDFPCRAQYDCPISPPSYVKHKIREASRASNVGGGCVVIP
jgi:hypothetical protein